MNSSLNIWTISSEAWRLLCLPVAYVFIVIFLLLAGFFTSWSAAFSNAREASPTMSFLSASCFIFLKASVECDSGLKRLGRSNSLTMPITAWQASWASFWLGCSGPRSC